MAPRGVFIGYESQVLVVVITSTSTLRPMWGLDLWSGNPSEVHPSNRVARTNILPNEELPNAQCLLFITGLRLITHGRYVARGYNVIPKPE
jgi:hypothetical protein